MQNVNWRTRTPPFFHFSNYSTPTYVGYTAAELQFTRNPAINVAADCLAAPRRNFEAETLPHGSALHLWITFMLLL